MRDPIYQYLEHYSGLSLKIEVEGGNEKVEGGLGVLLIATLCLKCKNRRVIKAS